MVKYSVTVDKIPALTQAAAVSIDEFVYLCHSIMFSIAPSSLITYPSKPHSFLKMSVSNFLFAQAGIPLILSFMNKTKYHQFNCHISLIECQQLCSWRIKQNISRTVMLRVK